MARTQRYIDQAREFVRDYADGLNVSDLRRLFDRDAPQAYAVLARDQKPETPGDSRPRRLLHRARVVFLGVTSKLTPARRLVFTASLVFALIGLLKPHMMEMRSVGLVLTVGTGTFWFLLSIGCLFFLLVMELVDRIRVRDELEVARQLQRELLPSTEPAVPGYRFAHSYRTANEVGGDYYDFPVLPDGRVALLVGDASGHGIAAGLLMAIANATLKTALEVDPDPPRVADLLNRTLYRTGDNRAFMTLFCGLLEPAGGKLRYVSAGHPFPLLRRAGGEIRELGRGSLPLGLRPTAELPTAEVTLEPGDLLVLYSDGLPEAVGGPDKQAFGFERLRGLLRDPGTPEDVRRRILAAFDDHLRGEPLHDDLSLVVVGRDGGGSLQAPGGPR